MMERKIVRLLVLTLMVWLVVEAWNFTKSVKERMTGYHQSQEEAARGLKKDPGYLGASAPG